MNILFFSRYSSLCVDLLKLMHKYDILNEFELKCVDDINPPQGITHVPTLVIKNYPGLIVGKKTIEWFEYHKENFEKKKQNQQTESILNNMDKYMKFKDGPKQYSNLEDNGFSDGFAYVNDDGAQPKNFAIFGKENTEIFTQGEAPKMNYQEQMRAMEAHRQLRNQTLEIISQRMKQEQEYAIIENEKKEILLESLGMIK